jgi:hypothetical protein
MKPAMDIDVDSHPASNSTSGNTASETPGNNTEKPAGKMDINPCPASNNTGDNTGDIPSGKTEKYCTLYREPFVTATCRSSYCRFYPGVEADVVLANLPSTDGVGFVREPGRLNSMLSRAKYGRYFIRNFEAAMGWTGKKQSSAFFSQSILPSSHWGIFIW